MSNKVISTAITFFLIFGGSMSEAGFYDSKINSIGGQAMDLSAYKGKPVLLVNIATQCGYTPQLKGLEGLYQKYKEKGLVVIGIPSNDFGGQTPQENKDVKKFCELNYGVTFPLTIKTVVKGQEKHPLISHLIKESGDSNDIGWNFEKFLVGKDGKVIGRFSSSVKPDDKTLEQKIMSQL